MSYYIANKVYITLPLHFFYYTNLGKNTPYLTIEVREDNIYYVLKDAYKTLQPAFLTYYFCLLKEAPINLLPNIRL